jgi:hypothetical protein
MEFIPVIFLLCVAAILSWLASLPKRHDLRTVFCLLVVVGIAIVVAAFTFQSGGYYLRARAYKGNLELKRFFNEIQSQLESDQTEAARMRIEFILEHWHDTEFIENNPDYGIWIGDQIDKSNLLKYDSEPVDADNQITRP